MHYKFKAMKKVMEGVSDEVDGTKRPILEKFREIAGSKEPSEEMISIINNEISKINEIINETVTGKNNCVSKKIEAAMKSIDIEIVEALSLYLSAWELIKKVKSEQGEEKMTEEAQENAVHAVSLAEESERKIMEIEKLMAEIFNEYPVET